ncbi:MAG: SgcJ/EcaC family oxidoreductase [Elainellaceae cyanobacterium]
MAVEPIEQIVEQAKTAWQDGDADGFANLFLPDGELVVPGQQWQGRSAIRQAVLDFSSTHCQVKIEIQRIVASGDCAVVEWIWEDVENNTGKRSHAEDAIVIDFQANQIRRWREYIDTQTS